MTRTRWNPPVSAVAAESPLATRSLVRVVDSVARTARPSAPPTWSEVFTSPEARPESLGVALDMASVMTDGNESPAPTPRSTIDGNMSTR